jgi:nucleoside-triphosphatase THEP1
MSKAFELVFVGLDEKCQEVYLPRFHTLVSGASGVGKTEAIRRIIVEMLKAIPDLKVVIFDVKETKRDWGNFGSGYLVKLKTKPITYRLPTKLKINISQSKYTHEIRKE